MLRRNCKISIDNFVGSLMSGCRKNGKDQGTGVTSILVKSLMLADTSFCYVVSPQHRQRASLQWGDGVEYKGGRGWYV